MESPETCLTNVLKIENLSRIPYTLYRPSDDNPPQPQPPQPQPSQQPQPQQLPQSQSQSQSQSRLLPASLNRHTTNALRHAERTLRTEGNIVYADRDSVTLWLFQIEGFPSPPGNTASGGAGNGKDACGDDSMEGEVQAQIAEEETSGKWKRIDARLRDEWGLRESSSGTFLASALAPPQPPHTATFHSSSSRPATPGFPPTPMSGMFPPSSHSTPAAIDITDDGASEDASLPEDQFAAYKRFITAVLLSLHFEMAAGSGYTPLNIRTLVSPASLRLSISEERGGEKEDTGKADQQLLPSTPVVVPEVIRPTVVALDAYLTTSGTLLIIPHTEVQPAIRRVSSCATRGMGAEEGLDGRDVYIAPWGEWGRLLPSTPTTEPATSAKELKWKGAVRSYLQDCGILSTPGNGWRGDSVSVLEEAIQAGDWRRIEIWIPFKEFPGMGMAVKVLWPEALLFMKASEDDTIPCVDEAQAEDAAEGENVFWKTVFADPEYGRFASGSLSMSLASLVFAEDGQQLPRARKDTGADWWATASAVEWAEEWLAGREERDRVVKARLEEKKALRRKREEAERQAAEREEESVRVKVKKEEEGEDKAQVQAQMEMEVEMPEAMDTKEDKAKLKVLEQKNPAGVYPTPPEGGQQTAQPMGGTGGPGSTSSGSAPSSTVISAEAIIGAVPTETDMELDWTAELPGVADQVPEPGRKQSDAAAIGGLAGGTGEADLFGGDMDDDDMFGHAITEDDFAFFDNNPGGLEDFGDDLGGMGEDDVNMALEDMDLGGAGGSSSSNINAQAGGGGGGEMDLTMEIPMHAREEMVIESSPAAAMMAQPPTINIDVSRADGHHDAKLSGGSASDKLAEREPHIQTPPLSPHRAIRLLVPEYSLSPNNQPHPTPPTTGGAMKTPQNNGAPPPPLPPPSGGVSEAKRRMSLYSPITFTTKIEMADRKYAPGGRYFLPESIKDKELKEFESKQGGKLETPKVPPTPSGQKRKRGIFVRSVVVEEGAEAAAPEVAEVVLADDAVMAESPEDDECDAGEYSDDEWSEESSVESDADDETEEEDEADAGGRYYTSPLAVAYGGGSGGGGGGGSKKRKWAFEDDGESSVAETMMKRETGADGEGGEGGEVPGELAPPPWEVMVPDPTDASLVGVFSTMTLETDAISLAGLGEAEFMAVSKLVREQVVSGTSKPLGALLDGGGGGGGGGGGAWVTAVEDDNEEWCLLRRRKGKDEEVVEEAARALFGSGGVVRCTLETYVTVADAVIEPPPPPPPLLVGRAASMRPIAQPRRGINTPTLSKRPSDPATPANSAIFRLPPPHVHIHRAEQALEILPPALHFWETFGFGPCSGPKSVIGFCLHPASRAMDDAADALLERVSFSYESGRFGTHVRGRLDASGITNGALGIGGPKDGGGGGGGGETAIIDSLEKGVAALMDGLAEFGAVLAGGVADELQNIVVYVVNPFEHPSAVVDICAGFVRMCRVYAGCVQMSARRNNLVLQIVPAGFVARRAGGVGRGQGEWAALAAEVYNRCMPTDGMCSLDEAQKTFSPSIYLARSPPKTIEFRATDPSPALLHENSILHIAYAQSLDERWVSVAWTDAWGELQATESYCLGRKNCTVLRPFDDVCRDIWARTLDITRVRRVSWRIMLTKVGPAMPPDEIDTWARLSRASMASLTHTLTLLTADVAPPLAVTPVLPNIAPAAFNPLVAQGTGTPPGVTTPTPGGGGGGAGSIVSPDQFGGAAGTPSADLLPEVDAGSALVDYGDEVWGVVCAHRWRRGLLLGLDDAGGGGGMGYLVKRGGAGEGDDMVVLGVEVVRGAGVGSGVLREVLAAWRDLVTLGQFKGVVEMAGRGSVVPWHVGAAWKGVEALGFVM